MRRLIAGLLVAIGLVALVWLPARLARPGLPGWVDVTPPTLLLRLPDYPAVRRTEDRCAGRIILRDPASLAWCDVTWAGATDWVVPEAELGRMQMMYFSAVVAGIDPKSRALWPEAPLFCSGHRVVAARGLYRKGWAGFIRAATWQCPVTGRIFYAFLTARDSALADEMIRQLLTGSSCHGRAPERLCLTSQPAAPATPPASPSARR
ncbi:MAG: hypothetical protein HY815_22945 [Candidatus Riflebacteria bacterium]|nr:hypothetical protein [Candidatus Riflebacteria bacterium]